MNPRIALLVLTGLLVAARLHAQGDTRDDVALFQAFFHDTPTTAELVGEAGVTFGDAEEGDSFVVGARGRYPLDERLEAGAGLSFVSIGSDLGPDESSISDLWLSARYRLPTGKVPASAGGYVTVPIGEEAAGQGRLDLGGFGALRYPLPSGLVITGTAGLDLVELPGLDDREASLLLGGGVIYPHTERLSLVGELLLESQKDYMVLSGGADLRLAGSGRLRGWLGLGLDDGAPDVQLAGSYLMTW
ncbi:MAG: hypothetical protein AB1505_15615 [Candidatus Latescibacterota bacterium]